MKQKKNTLFVGGIKHFSNLIFTNFNYVTLTG